MREVTFLSPGVVNTAILHAVSIVCPSLIIIILMDVYVRISVHVFIVAIIIMVRTLKW